MLNNYTLVGLRVTMERAPVRIEETGFLPLLPTNFVGLAIHLNFLSLGFLICKIAIIITVLSINERQCYIMEKAD